MAMGRQKDGQGDLMVSWPEMPRSPGHVFYDRLQSVLIEGGFDAFAEASCRPYYAARMGAPSVPPGRYFRMHLVGYFEGIDSERGLEWRCSDSLSLRAFLRLGSRDRVPDHSWLSRSRTRLPHEVHAAVFDWVLVLIAEAGLIKGERIGVDASTMEANAALRNIVRRDNGEGYREMLERLARESGVETPTAEDLARLDRKRKGKKLSNTDWVSKSDPEAKITKMKDGTTHLAYKPEHAVDLDTGAVVAAELHPADEGDTTTLSKTLAKAEANLEAVDAAPTSEDPAECVADKGYHSRAVLRALNDSPWKTRIAAPKQTGFSRWHGDEAARRAVTNNRARLKSGVAREAFKLRAEIVERCFAHNLDRGGMRRTWLRGRENVHKRYLLHVAGHNLSLLMRQLIGAGTPREAVAGGYGGIFVLLTPTGAMLVARGGLAKQPDGFRRRIPHLGVRAGKSHLINGLLRALNDSPWKTRIAAPKQTGFSRWHGDEAARRAVTNNRARLKSGVAREAFKLRAEIVERCFAHNLDRGGMRRTWLRGRENVHKRYLLHVAGHNLSLLMRQLIGAGTPREAVAGGYGGIFVLLTPTGAMLVARGGSQSGQTAFAAAFLIWE